jgi:hypothetical protein
MSVSRSPYASSACLRRALSAAAKAGIVVGSIKLHPDGAIELGVATVQASPAMNDFDRLLAAGAL